MQKLSILFLALNTFIDFETHSKSKWNKMQCNTLNYADWYGLIMKCTEVHYTELCSLLRPDIPIGFEPHSTMQSSGINIARPDIQIDFEVHSAMHIVWPLISPSALKLTVQ